MTNRWNDGGLVFWRFGVGLVFLVHGLQKALVFGPEGLAGFFGNIGIPFPYANALFIIGLETVGGLALIAGVLTRVFAPLLAATMAVAIWTVHLPNGFFMDANGYEFALLLLLANLGLTLTGAGAWSLDARLFAGSTVVRDQRRDLRAAA